MTERRSVAQCRRSETATWRRAERSASATRSDSTRASTALGRAGACASTMERIAGWARSVLGWASVHLGWAPSTSSPIPNDFPILFQFKSKALS
jgi:hypothetical protein